MDRGRIGRCFAWGVVGSVLSVGIVIDAGTVVGSGRLGERGTVVMGWWLRGWDSVRRETRDRLRNSIVCFHWGRILLVTLEWENRN